MLIDFHSHLNTEKNPNEIRVRSLDLRKDLASEMDPNIADYVIAGLHPWYIEELEWKNAAPLIRGLQEDSRCLGVGEFGLDKACDIDFDKQIEIFREHIRLANEMNSKPIVLHCVRAYSEIIGELNRSSFSGFVIFHDFNGGVEIVRSLAERGYFFSIGNALDRPESRGYQSIDAIPLDRIFLETDDSKASIRDRYIQLAKRTEKSVEEWERQIEANFSKVLGKVLD